MAWASPPSRTRLRRRRTALGRLLLAAGTIMLVLAAYAFAVPPPEERRLDRMVRFMQDAQNLDGGFGGSAGRASDPLFSAWVAIALAASGINPQDQAKPGGADVHTYVTAHASRLRDTTDFERAALAAIAAGTSLRDFGGVDLVARILERQRDDGAFVHTPAGGRPGVNDTIFAVLALSQAGGAEAAAAVQRAATWIIAAQNPDDGWPATSVGNPTDYDMTGAAMQALVAAGRRDDPVVAEAVAALRAVQNQDGGFPAIPADRESNTASTAWVVQGLWSVGIDPATWRTDAGKDPLDYLASMQQNDGSIGWKASYPTLNSLWMTAYAAPAYAGRFLPVLTVPRAVRPPPTTTPQPTTPAPQPPADGSGGGGGGAAGDDGGDVIAGGGGRNSRLFSSPKPQSKGRTRGGVRRTEAVAGERTRRARQAQARDVPDEQPAAAPRADRRQREQERRQRPPAARRLDPDAPAPDVRGTAAGDDAAGTAATAGAEDRAGSGGGGGDPEVTGKLIGGLPQDAGAAGDDRLAAPGLRGARAGGEQGPALALGIGGALFVFTGLGSLLERRRPEDERAVAT